MSYTYTGEFVFQREDIRKSNASKFLPAEKVEGTHHNCYYILEPETNSLTVRGNSREEIEECANQIIRTLHRKKDWRVTISEFLHNISGGGAGISSRQCSIDIVHTLSKTDFENMLQTEYYLPNFLNLLFREAIFNSSIGKPRIAFFLIYTTLERACKLLYVHCYGGNPNARVGIDVMLKKFVDDPSIQLRINLLDFESEESRRARGDTSLNYRIIRNAIGHSDPSIADLEIELFVLPLINEVDNIFRKISNLLETHQSMLV